MNQGVPRQIALTSLPTLEKSLVWYDDIVDALDGATGDRAESVREDILLARETAKREIARRLLRGVPDAAGKP